jgi:hypothetical protein
VSDRTKELQEAIDSADCERFATLEEAAADELMRLWEDLYEAVRQARNGYWSIGCENIAHRIAVLTRALGKATPWQQIQVDLLESGIYQKMHDLMGIPYEQPDMERIARMRRSKRVAPSGHTSDSQ